MGIQITNRTRKISTGVGGCLDAAQQSLLWYAVSGNVGAHIALAFGLGLVWLSVIIGLLLAFTILMKGDPDRLRRTRFRIAWSVVSDLSAWSALLLNGCLFTATAYAVISLFWYAAVYLARNNNGGGKILGSARAIYLLDGLPQGVIPPAAYAIKSDYLIEVLDGSVFAEPIFLEAELKDGRTARYAFYPAFYAANPEEVAILGACIEPIDPTNPLDPANNSEPPSEVNWDAVTNAMRDKFNREFHK